jgi:hypothetical protein
MLGGVTWHAQCGQAIAHELATQGMLAGELAAELELELRA